jgi:ribosome recycling factor
MATITEQAKAKMKAALDHFLEDIKGLRTGRANPGMMDNVQVEIYGAMMRVKDIATVNAPEARQLLITPFDPQNTSAIGKAIERANLGFMPIVDGNVVRIKIPPMDENLRKELIKVLHRKCEETKVSIRNIRRDSNEFVRKQKGSTIPEDVVKKMEKEIQDLTDKSCQQADEICKNKEKEISTI